MLGAHGLFAGRDEDKYLFAKLLNEKSFAHVRVSGEKGALLTTEEKQFHIPPNTDFEIMGKCVIRFTVEPEKSETTPS